MRQNRENKREKKEKSQRETHVHRNSDFPEEIMNGRDAQRKRKAQMWDKGHRVETSANTRKELGWENEGQRTARGKDPGEALQRSLSTDPLRLGFLRIRGARKGGDPRSLFHQTWGAALEPRDCDSPACTVHGTQASTPSWASSTDHSPLHGGERGITQAPISKEWLQSLHPSAPEGRHKRFWQRKTCGGFKLFTLRSEFLKAP